MSETEELKDLIGTLITKIDGLTNVIKEEKASVEEKFSKEEKSLKEDREIIKEETDIIAKLTDKLDSVTKRILDKKTVYEEKINENPIAFLAGAFAGGLIFGFLIGNKRDKSQ